MQAVQMIHALPNDVFVAIFDFYQGDAMHGVPQRVEVVLPGARMSKMAPYRPCIIMLFVSATFSQAQHSSEDFTR
jgi:hypothetical protein